MEGWGGEVYERVGVGELGGGQADDRVTWRRIFGPSFAGLRR